MNTIYLFFFLLVAVPPSYCVGYDVQLLSACSGKNIFQCGSDTGFNISYPFWGGTRPQYCGRKGFEIRCEDNQYRFIDSAAQKFRVLNISYLESTIMTIARDDLLNDYCSGIVNQEIDFNHSIFKYGTNVRNLSLFNDCRDAISPLQGPNYINCSIVEGEEKTSGFYAIDIPELRLSNLSNTCQLGIKVPVLLAALADLRWGNLEHALKQGFDVEYSADSTPCVKCVATGGICGSNNSNTEQFICLCPDQPQPHTCPLAHPETRPINRRLKTIIGVGAGLGGMGIMVMIFFLYRCRKKYVPSSYVSRNISSDPPLVADLEKADKILGVQVFSYTELEEATNHFDSAKELGDGGFGTVYYGKLQDGRAVAVKRLYENNYKRVEQFLNEVEILAHLRHTNLVTLYGCTSRHSRELLLVYEYVSNGTVADHLHGELTKPPLPWATRLNIAIETACALKYLHATDIIHRDVKTNNILLDSNFSVKVADFGLSRLFPTDVTHVSTAPQGTPGYVDPEYHQCYQLTEKSDVFSFGVVLVELISSMPAVDITRHRHEINLSNLAINKIQNKALHELVDPSLGFESDYKVRKMIYSVAELAFQCLQSDKDLRPFMTTVLDTLKDIQSDGYSKEKAEELDITDDVGLLKHGPPTPSPDSRTSMKTTPPTSN